MTENAFNLYFSPFALAFLVSIGLTALLIRTGGKKSSRSGNRHIHREAVTRWGGAAVIGGFLVAAVLDPNLVFSRSLWGVGAGSLAVLLFGQWDDFRELDWRLQLGFQALLASGLYFWGIRADYIASPFGVFRLDGLLLGLIFMNLWLMLTINSMNWLDGVDGAAGSVSVVAAAAIFFLSLKPEVNQPPLAIMAAAFGGAILGFLVLNVYPARIMAGTSGSMFFGFILGVLAIFAGAKVATALMVMTFPIVDLIWVIVSRLREGQSIFQADSRHCHHKLLGLGWSPRQVVALLLLLTVGAALLALNTRLVGKLVAILVSFASATLIIYGVNHKSRRREQVL